MFSTPLLNNKQVSTEIFCRLLKVVQEFIVRYTDIQSKTPYRVKWPKEEFCKQCHDEVNVYLNMESLFTELQEECASKGWRLRLSGPDWANSELMVCFETDGVRNDMLDQILGGLQEEHDTALIISEPCNGEPGFRLLHGKRSAAAATDELTGEGSKEKKSNTTPSDV